jgi:hypothetical protein
VAYDEDLAARVREHLAHAGVEEKRMFGGVGFLLNGNMLVGVWKDALVARLGAEAGEAALADPSAPVRPGRQADEGLGADRSRRVGGRGPRRLDRPRAGVRRRATAEVRAQFKPIRIRR